MKEFTIASEMTPPKRGRSIDVESFHLAAFAVCVILTDTIEQSASMIFDNIPYFITCKTWRARAWTVHLLDFIFLFDVNKDCPVSSSDSYFTVVLAICITF